MPSRLPRIIDDRCLNPVELRAATLDGELGALGAAYAIIDLPPAPATRAASLASLVPERVILSDRTAAWVWGWTVESGPLRVSVSKTARIASPSRRARRAREVVIDTDEIHELEGVSITSPERTLIDLARFDEAEDIVDLLAAGIRIAGMPPEVVAAALDRRPSAAGRRRARQRLTEALALARSAGDQPLLTRYTS